MRLLGVEVREGAGDAPAAPLLDTEIGGGIVRVQADRRSALITVAGIGQFSVTDGSDVRMTVDASATTVAVEAWLHGSVAAMLLGQRGEFALHAGTVVLNGYGMAIAGVRGAGKSTTALRLRQRGHLLVTDDVSPVDGTMRVAGFGRAAHLHADTARRLGLDTEAAVALGPGAAKLVLPHEAAASARLDSIVVLDVGERVIAAPIRGARALVEVTRHVYRGDLLAPLFGEELFRWSSRVADRASLWRITRPEAGWTVDAVADSVERIAAHV